MLGPSDVLVGAGALVRAPLWSMLPEPRYGAYWVERPGVESLFLPAGGDRWLFGAVVDPGDERRRASDADLVAWIRRAAGVPACRSSSRESAPSPRPPSSRRDSGRTGSFSSETPLTA